MNLDYGYNSLEKQMMTRAAKKRLPINGSLELLPFCNMSCDMCYVHLTPEQTRALGGLHTISEWLSVAGQMQEAGVLYLLLTGGEPLLYPDFRELYTGLLRMGMILTINTNGTLIDEDWADFFAQNAPRRINITLYGSDPDTYERLCHYREGYDRVLRGIRLLQERGLDVKVSTSVTPENIVQLDELHDLAESLGLTLHADTYMMPAMRERKHFCASELWCRMAPETAGAARIRALKRELSPETFATYRERKIFEVTHILPESGPFQNHCYAGKCSFTINWQGHLHPCVVLDQPSASVFTLGFQEAWQQVSQQFCSHTMSEHCSACELRPLCRTCLACARLETGSYDAVPEYMCRYAKASWEELLK